MRTGSTSNPDKTWSGWRAVADGERVGGGSRYLQYQVGLVAKAKAKGSAPVLRSVGFGHNGAAIEPVREIG